MEIIIYLIICILAIWRSKSLYASLFCRVGRLGSRRALKLYTGSDVLVITHGFVARAGNACTPSRGREFSAGKVIVLGRAEASSPQAER